MDIKDESPTPEENMEISERQRAVREAISELKEEYRTVITLCDIEGLSYDYIAEVSEYRRERLSRELIVREVH